MLNADSPRPRAVCVMSGGLDSAVSAAVAKNRGFDLHLLFFDYQQKSLLRERLCFRAQSRWLHPRESREVRVTWFEEIGNTLLVGDGEELSRGNRAREYVPFRNGLLLSYAVAWAEAMGDSSVFFGSTKGATTCPDNSPAFFEIFRAVVREGTKAETAPPIEVPLLELSKAEVVALGGRLGVPLELTWSCHNRNENPCGVCSNCEERHAAFRTCGQEDPLLSDRAAAIWEALESYGS